MKNENKRTVKVEIPLQVCLGKLPTLKGEDFKIRFN